MWTHGGKEWQSIRTICDISRDDRAIIAICKLRTATDRFNENYSVDNTDNNNNSNTNNSYNNYYYYGDNYNSEIWNQRDTVTHQASLPSRCAKEAVLHETAINVNRCDPVIYHNRGKACLVTDPSHDYNRAMTLISKRRIHLRLELSFRFWRSIRLIWRFGNVDSPGVLHGMAVINRVLNLQLVINSEWLIQLEHCSKQHIIRRRSFFAKGKKFKRASFRNWIPV